MLGRPRLTRRRARRLIGSKVLVNFLKFNNKRTTWCPRAGFLAFRCGLQVFRLYPLIIIAPNIGLQGKHRTLSVLSLDPGRQVWPSSVSFRAALGFFRPLTLSVLSLDSGRQVWPSSVSCRGLLVSFWHLTLSVLSLASGRQV